jgi:hypothetical protein
MRELLDAFFIRNPFSTAGEPSIDYSNVVAVLGVSDNQESAAG